MPEKTLRHETQPSTEPMDEDFLQWESEFSDPATEAPEITPEKPLDGDETEPLTPEQRQAMEEAFAALSNPGNMTSTEIAQLIHGLPVEVTRSDSTHEPSGWTIDRQYYDKATGELYVNVQKLGEPDEEGRVPTEPIPIAELQSMQRRLAALQEQDKTPENSSPEGTGETAAAEVVPAAPLEPAEQLERNLTPEQIEDFENRFEDIDILGKSYAVGKFIDEQTVGTLNKVRMAKARGRNFLQDLNPNPKYLFLENRIQAKKNKAERLETKLDNSHFGFINRFNQWRHDRVQTRATTLENRRNSRNEAKQNRIDRAKSDVESNNETHAMRIEGLKARAVLASKNKATRHLERSLRQSGMKRQEVFDAINKIPKSHMDKLARAALAGKTAERESRKADRSLEKVNTRLTRTERAIRTAKETSASESQNAVDYRERADTIEASLPEHRDELQALIEKREALSDDDPSSNGLDGMIAERQNAIDQLTAEVPKLREAALAADQKAQELNERAVSLEAQRDELRSERPSAVELQEARKDRMDSINSRIEELNRQAAEFATSANQTETTERP